jgi:16S rRNA (guanine966-N2)-methyltransferase
MRIIAGKYKKTNLFGANGSFCRPTTDYFKEVIFSVLFDCSDQNVLDLYAGSGALAFEALSRGANYAVMVDSSDKAIRAMKKNIEKLGCTADCRLHKKNVFSFLKTDEQTYDLIFLDPPYNKNLVNKTLHLIMENKMLRSNSKIIVEHSKSEKIEPEFADLIDYQKDGGETMITILKSGSNDEDLQ